LERVGQARIHQQTGSLPLKCAFDTVANDSMLHPVDILQSEVASRVPGLSAAAAVHGKIIWSHQHGFADYTTKVPVTAQTRFRIASVSKPLTSAGLALLVERGKLDLDAPIQKYLPDFPDKGAVLTTRLLAGHLSGIRNYCEREAINNPPVPNLRAGLRIFENDPLQSSPGTKFSYASYNWNVIGAVMEAAANQDFLSYMAENVISPLELADTLPERSNQTIPRRAACYEVGPFGQFLPAPVPDLSSKWPSGGYLSSAEDLVRFGSSLMRPGLLSANSLALLFTSQKTRANEPTNYGIGWMSMGEFRLHGGDTSGGTAILLTHPPSATVVAFAVNCGQIFLRNAIGRERVSRDSSRFLFDKVAIATKIARILTTFT
jgi:serine beta-lactamase-like protein LACTB